jgi:predicted DNA-binding protein (MmcQ/YjbR family)
MTSFEQVVAHLSAYPGATEEQPFGPDALVYKVGGKMFALISKNREPLQVNLKCDPDDAIQLRGGFAGIIPGYHMNKRHWNTVYLDASVPEPVVLQLMDESYDLVWKGLTKAGRARLMARI